MPWSVQIACLTVTAWSVHGTYWVVAGISTYACFTPLALCTVCFFACRTTTCSCHELSYPVGLVQDLCTASSTLHKYMWHATHVHIFHGTSWPGTCPTDCLAVSGGCCDCNTTFMKLGVQMPMGILFRSGIPHLASVVDHPLTTACPGLTGKSTMLYSCSPSISLIASGAFALPCSMH